MREGQNDTPVSLRYAYRQNWECGAREDRIKRGMAANRRHVDGVA